MTNDSKRSCMRRDQGGNGWQSRWQAARIDSEAQQRGPRLTGPPPPITSRAPWLSFHLPFPAREMPLRATPRRERGDLHEAGALAVDGPWLALMSSRQLLFKTLYRLGFFPWDGHPMSKSLCDLVEGDGCRRCRPVRLSISDAAPATTPSSWRSAAGGSSAWTTSPRRWTRRARRRPPTRSTSTSSGQMRPASVLRASVRTSRDRRQRLPARHERAGPRRLCPRSHHGRGTRCAAVDHRVHPGRSFGVPGIAPEEVERRFAPEWTLLSCGDEPEMDHNGENPARHYLFTRL